MSCRSGTDSRRGSTLIFLITGSFVLAACGTRPPGNAAPQPRYAVARFENLSGDPGLDWTARALSESLPVSLSGALDGPVIASSELGRNGATLGLRPAAAPGISTGRPDALLAGATRLITGYVERVAGQIRITAVEEELSTGKTLRTVTATGASPFAAIGQLASEFSPRARPALTSNAPALQAYATAFEVPPPAGPGFLKQAVQLDPNFGAAWVALVSLHVSHNDRPAAEEAIESASHQKLDDLSRAKLDLEAANVRNDRPGSIAAMRKIVSLNPADLPLLRALPEADTAAGDFESATSDYKKLTISFPEDVLAWNQLGYVRSYAGDYPGALAALQRYDRLRPNDANPQDSIGDLNYSFRKFKEAAANYLEAHRRQPDFEQAGDLYKAAWAKFESGDKQGADTVFAQFRTARAKSSGRVADLVAGDWLYRTGRGHEAFALLRTLVSETTSAPLRADSWAQLVVWDLIQHNRAQAAKDAIAISGTNSAPVFIARFVSLPSASVAEWENRAQAMFPPNVTALRQMALGYALLLDGKRGEALPVWEQIVKSTTATDLFARAVYARLQGKPINRPLVPEPNNLNQFAAILDAL